MLLIVVLANVRIQTISSPPGEQVAFTVNYDVMNNCASTVGSIVIGGVVEGVCPGTDVDNFSKVSLLVPGNLASGQHAGGPDTTNAASCFVYTNNVPTSAVAPISISITMSATGTDANGTPVGSFGIPLAVTW